MGSLKGRSVSSLDLSIGAAFSMLLIASRLPAFKRSTAPLGMSFSSSSRLILSSGPPPKPAYAGSSPSGFLERPPIRASFVPPPFSR